MPAEYPIAAIIVDQPQQEQQIKVCSSCHSTLVDPAGSVFLPEVDAIVCTGCRDRVLSSSRASPLSVDSRAYRIDVDNEFTMRTYSHDAASTLLNTRRTSGISSFDGPVSAVPSSSADANHSYHGVIISSPTYSRPQPLFIPNINTSVSTLPQHHQTHSSAAHTYTSNPPRRQVSSISSPDPLTDITRLRVRSQGHHCLYPGASFQGTQKSGRNSYDVSVTIVDVDFASSFLCGYLRIRGLTDDWPELTTYFDAEIIGSRHGFLTQNWGASEHEDLVHWSRFPAFKHVKHEAKKPRMTIEDRDRGAVFMRWKERFLVPDHRVQDINGASFAGFYYVCVDFNPPSSSSTTRSTSQPMPLTPETDDMEMLSYPPANKPEGHHRARRDSSVRRRTPSLAPLSAPVATMSGFYYHQNSEPYQQLSLCHVPERFSSGFEFR